MTGDLSRSGKPMSLDDRFLSGITRNAPVDKLEHMSIAATLRHLPIILHDIRLPKFAKKVFVVSDYDQLEIRVILALVDNAIDDVSV